jgi:hypothetical protein
MCAIVDGMNVRDGRVHNPPRGETPRRAKNYWSFVAITDRRGIARPAPLGPDPILCNDPKRGRKPNNAKCETVRDLPTFREGD